MNHLSMNPWIQQEIPKVGMHVRFNEQELFKYESRIRKKIPNIGMHSKKNYNNYN